MLKTSRSKNSQACLVVAQQVEADSIQTKVLLAGQVEGPVETLLDTQQVAIFGAVLGVVTGVVLFMLGILLGRKS